MLSSLSANMFTFLFLLESFVNTDTLTSPGLNCLYKDTTTFNKKKMNFKVVFNALGL